MKAQKALSGTPVVRTPAPTKLSSIVKEAPAALKSETMVPSSKTSPTPTSSTEVPGWRKAVDAAVEHNQANPERQSFQMSYHKKSTKRIVKRRIDPLRIKGNLLLAFDHKRKALRSFHLDGVKSMEKSAFWEGFLKQAYGPAELAGLATLAAPSVAHLTGNKMSDRSSHVAEAAGLGILATPYLSKAYKNMKGGMGLLKALHHS